ncbi:hypothetical protein D9M68_740090 [compost metagenome]
MKVGNFVENNFKYSYCRYRQEHAGNTPYQATDKYAYNCSQCINADFVAHQYRQDHIAVDQVYNNGNNTHPDGCMRRVGGKGNDHTDDGSSNESQVGHYIHHRGNNSQ